MPNTNIATAKITVRRLKKLREDKITLGTDPELEIVDVVSGRTLPANDVFKPDNWQTDELGYDGHNATAEMRIKPAKTPAEAVRYVHNILERNKKRYPQLFQHNLMASSRNLSLGGHLHFGSEALRGGNSEAEELRIQLVRNLDNLLAFPAMFLEVKEHSVHRRMGNYGHLSDYRSQTWGIEYRTLGSFISSKELTTVIFYVGEAIADATINYGFKAKNNVDNDAFDYAFNRQSRDLLKPHLKKTFAQLRALPKYKTNKTTKREIEHFISLVKESKPLFGMEVKEGWNIYFDINEFWKVDKIETLVEKLAKLLISVHANPRKYKKPATPLVMGSVNDYACPEIADTVNRALGHLINEELLKSKRNSWKRLRVYGLKKEKGNEVHIGRVEDDLSSKRTEQLLAICWDIAGEFGHDTKIEKIEFKRDTQPYSIGFGRAVREENLLLAEAIVIAELLLINKDLYKNQEKIGKKIKHLNVTNSKIVKPMVEGLKKGKKITVKVPTNIFPQLNGAELPPIIGINKSFEEIKTDIHDIASYDHYELERLSYALTRYSKRLGIAYQSGCVAHCEERLDLYGCPLSQMCAHHTALTLYRVLNEYLPLNTEQAMKLKKNRGENSPCGSLSCTHRQCDNCERCIGENCSCYECSSCGDRVSEDNWCYNCEHCQECCVCNQSVCVRCDDSVDNDDYCSDCDRCNECCECEDEPEQQAEQPAQQEPVTVTSQATRPTQAVDTNENPF